jgi:hypothetical protein
LSGDFNNVGNFGCKFVNGATNGPGTYSLHNQWYTMSLGLGTNYSFGQYVCQIAIPRATTNPKISVRFKPFSLAIFSILHLEARRVKVLW